MIQKRWALEKVPLWHSITGLDSQNDALQEECIGISRVFFSVHEIDTVAFERASAIQIAWRHLSCNNQS